jgi:hypothetical protein
MNWVILEPYRYFRDLPSSSFSINKAQCLPSSSFSIYKVIDLTGSSFSSYKIKLGKYDELGKSWTL